MKVLVFTATYGQGPQPETIASVEALEFAGRYMHEVSWHNPWPGADPRNITAQMERGRALALEGGYDAMLSVEHDMRLPPDALQKLWDVGAPVVYGVYLFRHGFPVLNAYQKYPPPSSNVGESLSVHPRLLENALREVITEVSGIGFGCTLIRREVLAAIAFRDRDRAIYGTDTMFALDCLRGGFRQMAHLGVRCGHWNGRRWLMPFEAEYGDRVRVCALQTMVVRAGMASLPITAGLEYELPEVDARELARAGYVRLLEGP